MNDWLWQIIPWGYNILLNIEHWRTPVFDTFFSGITFLGSEWFYILFLPIVYWSIGKEIGLGLSYASLFSTYLNDWLKNYFAIPRPYDDSLKSILVRAGVTRQIDPLFHETSPSWPSNHSQGSVIVWGYLASQLKKGWFWALAILLAGSIAFSRMYGGVHFPQDVISGILLGVILLCLWLIFEGRVVHLLVSFAFRFRIILVILVPLLGFMLIPSSTSGMIAGTLLGLGTGYLIEAKTTDFLVAGPWYKKGLRSIVGVILILGIYLALKALFSPITGEFLVIIFRMIRYCLVSLTASFFAPLIFIKIGLADSGKIKGT
ncbi:MAG: phosphatase PAP2 family protein [Anaerolineales bacterium]|nr:phosphatase PAP2 family protein [Anaerolineales bacterium]